MKGSRGKSLSITLVSWRQRTSIWLVCNQLVTCSRRVRIELTFQVAIFIKTLGKWETSESLDLRGKRPGDFNRLESPLRGRGVWLPLCGDMVVSESLSGNVSLSVKVIRAF
jgi:hypothetical protein